MTFENFIAEAKAGITALNSFVEKQGLIRLVRADHIGFRCDSHTTFEAVRSLLERESEYIYQSIISDRPIAIIKFRSPLQTNIGPIAFLELADQKPDGSQKRGFDHIEMYPVGISYDVLVTKLESSGVTIEKKVRPHHTTHDIRVENFIPLEAPAKAGADTTGILPLTGFTLRLESEPLIEKIRREEFK
ncbi:MAG: hypothetical protein FJY98_04415 [Candidatus Liptonbacteria bacterium]|nr:hypothetical protein [Candidatus Liptonbacteria bacterium]